MSCVNGRRHRWRRRLYGQKLHTGSIKLDDDQCIYCRKFRFEIKSKQKFEKLRPTVWNWLGISKKDLKKISGRGKCVKCGKPTGGFTNLCRGHHSAYHRWTKKREKELRKKGYRGI